MSDVFNLVIDPPPVYSLTLTSEQGPPGPPGSGTIDAGALHISQRLSEFDTPTARQQARANLELDTIDGGVFT